MSAQILASKLRIPRIHSNIMPRPRLTQRLSEGLSSKLTLVCAPPGYGKTSLLHEWAVRHHHRIGWLSLDSGDNVPAVLVDYLLAALESIDAALGSSIRDELAAKQTSPMESLSIALVNKLDVFRSQSILILDDYHVVENAAIHEWIALMLECLPPNLHLIISSRFIPSLPLARLRVRGEINELRTEDLRFNFDETLDFFRRSSKKKLSAASIAVLHNSTEGWIDGLQRATRALPIADGDRDADGVATALANDPSIMDYFGEEVLSHAPYAVQEFLLQTSILDHFNSSLCEAVTDDRQAHLHLNQIVRQNMFVLASRQRQEWFRYHRLFATSLRRRLQETHLDRVPQLHHRASVWYEEQGVLGEAIQHALSGQDWERARRLMATNAETMALQGQLMTANRWLVDLTMQASQGPSAKSNNSAIDYGQSMPALLGSACQSHDPATALALARIHIALGEVNKAEALLTNIDLTPPSSPDAETQLALICALGEIFLGQGKLHSAAATYRPFLKLAASKSGESSSCRFFWGVARVHYEWNQLDDAAAILQQCISMGDGHQSSRLELLQCSLLSAAVYLAAGKQGAYAAAMEQAALLVDDASGSNQIEHLTAHHVRMGLMRGDLNAAAQWLERCTLDPTDSVTYGRQLEYMTLAWAAIAHSQASLALPLLDRLYHTAEVAGRGADLIEIGALKALAFQSAGDPRRAFAELANVLCMAEPERFVRTFLDKGVAMGELLQVAHARGVTLLYVRELLTALPGPVFAGEKSEAVSHRLLASEQLVEPLTARELEVLELVASGCSNRQVADALTIATSTVKKHMGNILGKLGAKNRTEAAAKARTLHLF